MSNMSNEFISMVNDIMEGEIVIVEGRKMANDLKDEVFVLFDEVVELVEVEEDKFEVKLLRVEKKS